MSRFRIALAASVCALSATTPLAAQATQQFVVSTPDTWWVTEDHVLVGQTLSHVEELSLALPAFDPFLGALESVQLTFEFEIGSIDFHGEMTPGSAEPPYDFANFTTQGSGVSRFAGPGVPSTVLTSVGGGITGPYLVGWPIASPLTDAICDIAHVEVEGVAAQRYVDDGSGAVVLDLSFVAEGYGDMLSAPHGETLVGHFSNYWNWRVEVTYGYWPTAFSDAGSSLPGLDGAPLATGQGDLSPGSEVTMSLQRARPEAPAGLLISTASVPVAFFGGTLVAWPLAVPPVLTTTDVRGEAESVFRWPHDVTPGTEVWAQWAVLDDGAPQGVALSNALHSTTP